MVVLKFYLYQLHKAFYGLFNNANFKFLSFVGYVQQHV